MCYMAVEQDEHEPARVGVRELRQNLSVYLRRVERGESLVVTEHGRPVARLAPLVQGSDVIERLVLEGRLIPAERSIDAVLPVTGKPDRKTGRAIVRALEELRQDRM